MPFTCVVRWLNWRTYPLPEFWVDLAHACDVIDIRSWLCFETMGLNGLNWGKLKKNWSSKTIYTQSFNYQVKEHALKLWHNWWDVPTPHFPLWCYWAIQHALKHAPMWKCVILVGWKTRLLGGCNKHIWRLQYDMVLVQGQSRICCEGSDKL